MRGQQRRERLRAAAAPLEPKVFPFYVRSDEIAGVDDRYEAPGWYWQPHDALEPEYLAFDSIKAEFKLLRLQEERWRAEQTTGSAA